jgi:UDP-N-acetylglucosamine 4,6-dehydratase/5-epimerase
VKILVTGAAGSIGSALLPKLEEHEVWATDVEDYDVTAPPDPSFLAWSPERVIHLAGAKSAPEGEDDPWQALLVNAQGTANVVAAFGERVITASTCKACDPETVYGATKLVAERITLQAGGSVARFYNVKESGGNVFELWRSLPDYEPIPVTPCSRRFISIEDAVALLRRVLELPPGIYAPRAGAAQFMSDVASEELPGREQMLIPPRRGDRLHEPRCAQHEHLVPFEGVCRVVGAHDREAVAA